MAQRDSTSSRESSHPSLTSSAMQDPGRRCSVTISFSEQRFSATPARSYAPSIRSTTSSMTLMDVLRNEAPSILTLHASSHPAKLRLRKLFSREKKMHHMLRRGSVESGIELELGREQIKCHPDFDQVLRSGFSKDSEVKPTLKISLTPRVAKAGPNYAYPSLQAH